MHLPSDADNLQYAPREEPISDDSPPVPRSATIRTPLSIRTFSLDGISIDDSSRFQYISLGLAFLDSCGATPGDGEGCGGFADAIAMEYAGWFIDNRTEGMPPVLSEIQSHLPSLVNDQTQLYMNAFMNLCKDVLAAVSCSALSG